MQRDSALDVLSPSFDPELALASPALSEQLCALFPQARPLNNTLALSPYPLRLGLHGRRHSRGAPSAPSWAARWRLLLQDGR